MKQFYYFLIVFSFFLLSSVSFGQIDHWVIATPDPDEMGGSGTHLDPWLNIHSEYWDDVNPSETVAFSGTFFVNSYQTDYTLLNIPKSMNLVKWEEDEDNPIFDGYVPNDNKYILYGIRVDNKNDILIQNITFRNFERNYI